MSDERALELTEASFQLIAAAQADLTEALAHRDAVLGATFAAANIPVGQVLRIDSVDGKKVLYYLVPNGGPAAEGD